MWQMYILVGAPLWYHDNTMYLLDLRVVRWGYSVQVARNLWDKDGRGGISALHYIQCSHRDTMALHVLYCYLYAGWDLYTALAQVKIMIIN